VLIQTHYFVLAVLYHFEEQDEHNLLTVEEEHIKDWGSHHLAALVDEDGLDVRGENGNETNLNFLHDLIVYVWVRCF